MRTAVAERAQDRSQLVTIPAPVHGLVYSAAVAKPDPLGAEVLENWFPTYRGIAIRGGCVTSAIVTGGVTGFMDYVTSAKSALFAATASTICDISGLSGALTAATLTGFSGGDWEAQQIGTPGGDYLLAFNGVDDGLLYDGVNWNPITDVAISEIGYTGLTGTWALGTTLTGGTSGATATILGITPTKLKLGTITGGPFASGEPLSATGATATSSSASSSASTNTITGVATSSLKSPWLFGNRIFAIEKGTLNAWYWPVDSISGALQSFSLAGVFQKGGELVFGCAWSADAGAADGIRYFDHCVFVSSEGEIATYRGSYSATDPAVAGDWILAGRYNVSAPLGSKCHMKAGGDVAIATVAGVVPMSAITSKDPGALAMSAVSHPIDPLWQELYQSGESVQVVKWVDKALGIFTCPGNSRVLTIHLQTGAWAQQTGWDASALVVYNGQAYMGRSDGKILALDKSGTDDGNAFTAKYCHSFRDMGSAAQFKMSQMVRGTFFAGSTSFIAQAGISTDYTVKFSTAPGPSYFDLSNYLVWDASNWDVGLWWDASVENATSTEVTKWQAVPANGYTMAPTWQITSGGATKFNIELTRTDIAVERGGWIV